MKNQQSATCDGCYWKDNCDYSSPCEYYDPLDDDHDDEKIHRFIEKERLKFRREWYEYIKEFE